MKRIIIHVLCFALFLFQGALMASTYNPTQHESSAIGTYTKGDASAIVNRSTDTNRDMEVLYDQPYHDLTAPFSWARSSDENYDYICYDNFSGVSGTILGVSVTGQSAYFNGINWLDVNEDPMTFNVVFYEDNNGIWGNEITSVQCTATREFLFSSGNNVYKWDLVFPYGIELESGWISVRGCSIGNPIDGIFMWRTGDGGDGHSYLNTMLVDLDQGFTLLGTTSAGTFPAAPTNLTLTSNPAGLNECTIQWNNPDQTACLEPLTELTQIKIFRGETLIHTIENPTIGAVESYTDTFSEPGFFNYTIQGINTTGDGLTAIVGNWLGEDYPNKCTNITLSQPNQTSLEAVLSWENPTIGMHGGVFNNPPIGYHIYRSDGESFELDGNTTSFTDDSITHVDYYQYDIIPYNTIGNGPTANSNVEIILNNNTLFTESFPEFPIPGWTSEGDNWFINTANHAGGFKPELVNYFYPQYIGVQKVISPTINTTDSQSLNLSFKTALYSQQASGYEVRIETSSNGTDWQEVWSHDPSQMNPQTLNITIDNSDVGSPNFQLAFIFDGDSNNFICWYIDSVILTSTGGSSFGSIEGLVSLTGGFGNIEDVIVSCAGTSTHPDDTGHYSMDLSAGTYQVRAELDGYETVINNDIIVTAGNTTSLDIALSPVATQLNPPQSFTVNDTTGLLSWTPPQGYSTWIGYDDGENYNAVGTNSPMLLSVASRWEAGSLDDFNGMQITSIKFFPTVVDLNYVLTIWNGANASTVMYEQTVDNIIENQWNEIVLDTPYTIDASQEMWFGYCVETNSTNPAGTDDGPAIIGYGDLIRLDDDDWSSMAETYQIDHNWNLKALVNNTELTRNTREFLGYSIYLDGAQIATNVTNMYYVLQGLEDGEEYTAGVSAIYTEGESEIITQTFTFHQGTLAAPENLAFSNETSVFSWDAVTQATSHDSPVTLLHTESSREITGYDVFLDDVQIATNIEETSIILDDLVDNQEYTAGVRAVYQEGYSSTTSLTFTYDEPVQILPPVDVTVDEDTGLVTWLAPGTTPDGWIGYNNEISGNAIGTDTPNNFNVAIRWDTSQLEEYDGMALSKIRFVAYDPATTYKLRVWTGAEAANMIVDQEISTITFEDWFEVELETPVVISDNEELWIGYNCQTQGQNPAGIDNGPAVQGYGDLIQFNNGDWNTLSGNYNLNYNWLLEGFVMNADGTEQPLSPINPEPTSVVDTTPERLNVETFSTRDLLSYSIYLDGNEIATDVTETQYQLTGLIHGEDYIVGVKALYDEGESIITAKSFTYMGTHASAVVPAVTALVGNYPNPFNPVTTIQFTLKEKEHATLNIYNIRGELVKTLVNETMDADLHSIQWNGTDNHDTQVTSGVYFYRLHTSSMTQSKKMILLK